MPRPAPAALRWILLLTGLVLVAGLVLLWRMPAPSPALPALPASHAELPPDVRKAILRAFEQLRAAPDDAASWGDYGIVLHGYGLAPDAIAAFHEAVRLDATQARWWYYLGSLQLSRGDTNGLTSLAQAVSHGNEDTPRLLLAEALSERGRTAEARALYEGILGLQSDHPMARLHMARLMVRDGKLDTAMDWLSPCLTNRFTSRRAYQLLAQIEQRRDNPKVATVAQGIATSLPEDLAWPDPMLAEPDAATAGRRALLESCQKLLHQGRFNDAFPQVQALTQRFPEAAEGWLYLGRYHYVNRQDAQAEAAFMRHLELDPQSVDGHIQMGQLRLRQGKVPEAIAHLEAAIRTKPDAEGAHYNLGMAHLKAGDRERAVASFQAAQAIRPSFLEAHLSLGQTLLRLGRQEEGLEALQTALMVNPYDLRAQAMLEKAQAGRN